VEITRTPAFEWNLVHTNIGPEIYFAKGFLEALSIFRYHSSTLLISQSRVLYQYMRLG
jgi:hypothetical protein